MAPTLMRWTVALAALVLAGSLSSCYLPVRFDAEIEISRQGAYSMIFDGYLVDVQFYDGLRQGKIDADEERRKIKLRKTDLTRDSAVKEFQYIEKGHFKVNWQKRGDLLRAKMVTFVRRNENLLSIQYVKKKRLISVAATPIAKEAAKRLIAIGLNMEGQLRVKTDAKVVSHNAQKIVKDKTTGKRFYIWNVKSLLEPSPKLAILFR